jgi:hypothetical protein
LALTTACGEQFVGIKKNDTILGDPNLNEQDVLNKVSKEPYSKQAFENIIDNIHYEFKWETFWELAPNSLLNSSEKWINEFLKFYPRCRDTNLRALRPVKTWASHYNNFAFQYMTNLKGKQPNYLKVTDRVYSIFKHCSKDGQGVQVISKKAMLDYLKTLGKITKISSDGQKSRDEKHQDFELEKIKHIVNYLNINEDTLFEKKGHRNPKININSFFYPMVSWINIAKYLKTCSICNTSKIAKLESEIIRLYFKNVDSSNSEENYLFAKEALFKAHPTSPPKLRVEIVNILYKHDKNLLIRLLTETDDYQLKIKLIREYSTYNDISFKKELLTIIIGIINKLSLDIKENDLSKLKDIFKIWNDSYYENLNIRRAVRKELPNLKSLYNVLNIHKDKANDFVPYFFNISKFTKNIQSIISEYPLEMVINSLLDTPEEHLNIRKIVTHYDKGTFQALFDQKIKFFSDQNDIDTIKLLLSIFGKSVELKSIYTIVSAYKYNDIKYILQEIIKIKLTTENLIQLAKDYPKDTLNRHQFILSLLQIDNEMNHGLIPLKEWMDYLRVNLDKQIYTYPNVTNLLLEKINAINQSSNFGKYVKKHKGEFSEFVIYNPQYIKKINALLSSRNNTNIILSHFLKRSIEIENKEKRVIYQAYIYDAAEAHNFISYFNKNLIQTSIKDCKENLFQFRDFSHHLLAINHYAFFNFFTKLVYKCPRTNQKALDHIHNSARFKMNKPENLNLMDIHLQNYIHFLKHGPRYQYKCINRHSNNCNDDLVLWLYGHMNNN